MAAPLMKFPRTPTAVQNRHLEEFLRFCPAGKQLRQLTLQFRKLLRGKGEVRTSQSPCVALGGIGTSLKPAPRLRKTPKSDTAGEFKRARPETALACAISPAPGSDTPESDSNVRVTLRCWPYEMK